ncbi:mucin-17-like [Saccostrea echinata]|uniref:mucin-17-like n=1 Tax=Saccostrea echinata TaxID=191078 RepID=UPI002A83C433|nr:mucin-17-like [Saccostrea echinata]
MECLKTGWNLLFVLSLLFIKSSVEQGFTPFGFRGFGRPPPLFPGFGPPPPGVRTLLPAPLGFPGIPGPPPLPIISPPVTTLADGGTGSITLSGETVPTTFDLSGFSNTVQTLPATTDTASIVGQSGFDGGLITLGESANTLEGQNLITTLTGQDTLLGGTATSIANGLATGLITSDAGVPEGVNPASAAESSFVSRFSNSNSNDGASSQMTVNGQLNSFDSVTSANPQTFDASAILNTVFGNSNADPSSSRITGTATDNSPNRIVLSSGVSNDASPSNLIQRQAVSVENTGERIPSLSELQQMFTPTQFSNTAQDNAIGNGGSPTVNIQTPSVGSRTGVSVSNSRQIFTDPSGRNDETRIVRVNTATTINRIDDTRKTSQVTSPSDELNMDFRNFIRANEGQIDPNDILYRFPGPSDISTVSRTSNERMTIPSNSIFSRSTNDPNTSSRTTITEIQSSTNRGIDPLSQRFIPSVVTDPNRNQAATAISQNGNSIDNRQISRPSTSVSEVKNKSNIVINGNSNIVGSKVDMNKFIRTSVDVQPQSVNLQRSDFENTLSTVRSTATPINSISERFDVRTDPVTNISRRQPNNRIQNPVDNSQRGSKIMFVDGNNNEDETTFQEASATMGTNNQPGANFNSNFATASNQPGVNVNFNFPNNQPEVGIDNNSPTVSFDSTRSDNSVMSSQQTPGIQRFQGVNRELNGNVNVLEQGTTDTRDPNRIRERTTAQVTGFSRQPTISQGFQTTNEAATGRNADVSDPIKTGMTDPNIIRDGMSSETQANMERSRTENSALTSGSSSTRRFIKKTTTVRRVISNSNEADTNNLSQINNTRVPDTSNSGVFANLNNGINGMSTNLNANVNPLLGGEAAINRNRFVSFSNSADSTRGPQTMDVQNPRMFSSVLSRNLGTSNPFVRPTGTSNVNNQFIRTGFDPASNTQTGGAVFRGIQSQNMPSAGSLSFNSNTVVDPNSTERRFSSNVFTGNTGNSNIFERGVSSTDNFNNRITMTRSVPVPMSQSENASRPLQNQNIPSGSIFNPNSNAIVNPGSIERRFSSSFPPENNGAFNSQPSITGFDPASFPQTRGGVVRTAPAQNNLSSSSFPSNTDAASDSSSIQTRFMPSNSGSSIQSVQGSRFENNGLSRNSRQNTRVGGFVSMDVGTSSGTPQDPQSSVFETFGEAASRGSGFQTRVATTNNVGVRSPSAGSLIRNGAVSRRVDPNGNTIIETSRGNVVLSSEPQSNRNGTLNFMVQGTTLPPVIVANETQPCKTSDDCRTGNQCTYNRNFLCPDWADSITCQCQPGCDAFNQFIPLGSKITIDNCGNECVCIRNNGIISPRAEIITSPKPEVIHLPGGRQVIRGSPVPVLMNTSSSQQYPSPRKSQLYREQFTDNTIPRVDLHSPDDLLRDSQHYNSSYHHSKKDNSGEESGESPADDESTQNNPSSNSDILIESTAEDSRLSSSVFANQSGKGIERDKLVNPREHSQLHQIEQEVVDCQSTANRSKKLFISPNRRKTRNNNDNSSEVQGKSEQSNQKRLVSVERQNVISTDISCLQSNEVLTRKSPSPKKRRIQDKNSETNKGQSSAKKQSIMNPAKKKKHDAEQISETLEQSAIQLTVETPVVQSKGKPVKPRVIITEVTKADKKKKKKIRDKSTELVMQMWTGRDGVRLKKDVVDLDVIMHCVTETLNKCKEQFTEKPQQRALSKFSSQINADLASQIESKQSMKKINSNVKKSRKNMQALRKELQDLQIKKDNILEKIERAENESSVYDISSWMFGFQKFIKNNKTQMTKLTAIKEEDLVKIV